MRIWKEFLNKMSSNQMQINSAKSYCINIMEHLLKFYFSQNDFPKNGWKLEIVNKFQPSLNKCLYVGKTRKEILKRNYNENIFKEVNKELENLYRKAVKLYNKEIYQDLKINKKKIPSKCPWTLEELSNNNFEQLLVNLKG